MEISEQEFITMQATIRDLQEFKDNHIKNEERGKCCQDFYYQKFVKIKKIRYGRTYAHASNLCVCAT